MKEAEMRQIAEWMDLIIRNHDDETLLDSTRNEIASFCEAFPAPGITT